MKKLEIKQMEQVEGGRSRIHCIFAMMDIVIQGVVIHEASYATWDECRAARR